MPVAIWELWKLQDINEKGINIMSLTKLEECLNDYAVEFSKEYIKQAVGLCAFMDVIYPHKPEADPLDIEFFWDEEGFGQIAKSNLREEYLDKFNDDPAHYAPRMPAVIASLRSLADEIEKIHQSATKDSNAD